MQRQGSCDIVTEQKQPQSFCSQQLVPCAMSSLTGQYSLTVSVQSVSVQSNCVSPSDLLTVSVQSNCVVQSNCLTGQYSLSVTVCVSQSSLTGQYSLTDKGGPPMDVSQPWYIKLQQDLAPPLP
ncbi:hypothetical protein STEG23_016676 [Scotinomys teguina]